MDRIGGEARRNRFGVGIVAGLDVGADDLYPCTPPWPQRQPCLGSCPPPGEITSFGLAEDLDRVKRLADLGVARVMASFSPQKADAVLPIVDRWAAIMRRVNG